MATISRSAVRWLTTKVGKGGSAAPFEAQGTSATQRHRNARLQQKQQLASSDTTNDNDAARRFDAKDRGRHEAAGFSSQAHLASATSLHRRNRRNLDTETLRGSAAALMSATTQHRHQRKQTVAARDVISHIVNPSDLSLPVDPGEKEKEEVRGKTTELNQEEKERAPKEQTNPLARSAVRSLSLFVAVATVAAVGSGIIP